jgi:hypothetical protein
MQKLLFQQAEKGKLLILEDEFVALMSASRGLPGKLLNYSNRFILSG